MKAPAPRIGYVPYSASLEKPGDKRRFAAYATARSLKFEIANPEDRYDVVVLTEAADITIWSKYAHGKIVYDLIDSYLSIPRSDIKQWLRGTAWYFTRRYRHLRIDLWEAIRDMCRRADAVICSTDEQKRDIQPYCANAHVVLDVHDTVARTVKESYRRGRPFNLVWEGLPSNIVQLKLIREVLKELQPHHPLVLNLVTDPDQPRFLGNFGRIHSMDLAHKIFDSIKFHRWDEATCSSIIRECDLAVIPIDLSDPFVAGKPENKLLLLWRMGMPVVTSATPAYERAMRSAGLDRFTCKSADEWLVAITTMINDEAVRRNAGLRGKQVADGEYGRDSMLARWDSVFASLGYEFGMQ